MYITPNDISTHLYGEQVKAITGGDTEQLLHAIDAAIAEVRGYLTAYDIDAELAKEGDQRNPLLLIMTKDVVVWHFINICNVNTSLELRRDRYGRAIDWLKSVQKGEVSPNLPALPESDRTGIYIFNSNPKRNNHY